MIGTLCDSIRFLSTSEAIFHKHDIQNGFTYQIKTSWQHKFTGFYKNYDMAFCWDISRPSPIVMPFKILINWWWHGESRIIHHAKRRSIIISYNFRLNRKKRKRNKTLQWFMGKQYNDAYIQRSFIKCHQLHRYKDILKYLNQLMQSIFSLFGLKIETLWSWSSSWIWPCLLRLKFWHSTISWLKGVTVSHILATFRPFPLPYGIVQRGVMKA